MLRRVDGQISANGTNYGPQAGYEFLANEGPIPIQALEPTELFRAVLHTF